jgi:outer membrane translocation and assembly module TamA
VAFLDAGELYSASHDPSATGLKAAVGPGLRYDTLVGPLRFDYGYKLNPEAGESRSQWHLTIGYPF